RRAATRTTGTRGRCSGCPDAPRRARPRDLAGGPGRGWQHHRLASGRLRPFHRRDLILGDADDLAVVELDEVSPAPVRAVLGTPRPNHLTDLAVVAPGLVV